MSFLSGLLGALGGPGNIIKSVGNFVSDSLSGLAQGKGLGGVAEAGSKAIKTLIGDEQKPAMEKVEEAADKQISNSRPMIVTNNQIPRHSYTGSSAADTRPIFSGNQNQPKARLMSGVYPEKKYVEMRGTAGGFPTTKMVETGEYKKQMDGSQKSQEPQFRSKNQRRRDKQKAKKIQFKNYMR